MFKFLTKKKPTFKAQCMLSREPLERESTRVVTTADVISSKKFWDNVMTEPETMGYTKAYFEKGDSTAANIRSMIYQKYSKDDKLWTISDSQMHLFDVDENQAKEQGQKWWDSEGQYVPEGADASLKSLEQTKLEAFKSYAVEEAGRQLVHD